jgi:hypothetical protein
MSNQNNPNVTNALGALGGPITTVPLLPVKANRAPTGNDINFVIGQEWIYPAQDQVWFLTSFANGQANWVEMENSDGSDFLTYTGQTNGDVPLILALIPMADDSAITVNCVIVGASADYTEGMGTSIIGTARKDGVNPVVYVGVNTFPNTTQDNLETQYNLFTDGLNIELIVNGPEDAIWNWKAIIATDTLS